MTWIKTANKNSVTSFYYVVCKYNFLREVYGRASLFLWNSFLKVNKTHSKIEVEQIPLQNGISYSW
jgi:hypothetical protein